MNFITEISGTKVVRVPESGLKDKDICGAVLDNLIGYLSGRRVLVLNHISENEVQYRTKAECFFTKPLFFLNCFHGGHISVTRNGIQLVIKYRLSNYIWLFMSVFHSLMLLLLFYLLADIHTLTTAVLTLFCLVFGFASFFFSYIVFFLIPVAVWRHRLNTFNCNSQAGVSITDGGKK